MEGSSMNGKLMKELVKQVTEFLRNRRDIVKTVAVQVEYFDPTYGAKLNTEHIEVIDFNALLNAIDEFAEEFR
jgi:hypothetical protein